MKTLLLSFMLAFSTLATHAQDGTVRAYQVNSGAPIQEETVKLQIDKNNAYYQKVVKVDSNITVSAIYIRALQFMAAKNFQQNYGYEEEGKLIFTTTQDLNVNPVFSGTDSDVPNPYTVQFAIAIDMKNGRYRYTIHNVVFFLPTDNGNRRQTLFDMYQKSIDKDSRRVVRDSANKLIASFERYLTTLTEELYGDIEQKSPIHNTKF
jgi:hypothetical protein